MILETEKELQETGRISAEIFSTKALLESLKLIDWNNEATQETISTYDPNSESNNYSHGFMKAASKEKGQLFYLLQVAGYGH